MHTLIPYAIYWKQGESITSSGWGGTNEPSDQALIHARSSSNPLSLKKKPAVTRRRLSKLPRGRHTHWLTCSLVAGLLLSRLSCLSDNTERHKSELRFRPVRTCFCVSDGVFAKGRWWRWGECWAWGVWKGAGHRAACADSLSFRGHTQSPLWGASAVGIRPGRGSTPGGPPKSKHVLQTGTQVAQDKTRITRAHVSLLLPRSRNCLLPPNPGWLRSLFTRPRMHCNQVNKIGKIIFSRSHFQTLVSSRLLLWWDSIHTFSPFGVTDFSASLLL